MQHPVGYAINHTTKQPQLNNVLALFTNPTFLWGYVHVILASLVTGSLVMLAVAAWYLRRNIEVEPFKRSARLALVVLIPSLGLALFVGSELGVVEAKYQPVKIAAAEAQWTTCQPCSFSVFQVGGGNKDMTPTKVIAIPYLLSFLATNSFKGKVVGLNELQQQYTKQYGPGNASPMCSSNTGRCGSWPIWLPPYSCSRFGVGGCSTARNSSIRGGSSAWPGGRW